MPKSFLDLLKDDPNKQKRRLIEWYSPNRYFAEKLGTVIIRCNDKTLHERVKTAVKKIQKVNKIKEEDFVFTFRTLSRMHMQTVNTNYLLYQQMPLLFCKVDRDIRRVKGAVPRDPETPPPAFSKPHRDKTNEP